MIDLIKLLKTLSVEEFSPKIIRVAVMDEYTNISNFYLEEEDILIVLEWLKEEHFYIKTFSPCYEVNYELTYIRTKDKFEEGFTTPYKYGITIYEE